MDDEIKKAIELLTKNGYAVVKYTEDMKRKAEYCKECEAHGYGITELCFTCICRPCIDRDDDVIR